MMLLSFSMLRWTAFMALLASFFTIGEGSCSQACSLGFPNATNKCPTISRNFGQQLVWTDASNSFESSGFSVLVTKGTVKDVTMISRMGSGQYFIEFQFNQPGNNLYTYRYWLNANGKCQMTLPYPARDARPSLSGFQKA
jgi:hypothetical protein